jgi:hypothetical protein
MMDSMCYTGIWIIEIANNEVHVCGFCRSQKKRRLFSYTILTD